MMNRFRTRIQSKRDANRMPYFWRPAPPRH